MKAIQTGASPSTLDTLALCDVAEPPAPKAGEITVSLKASSLNFHDYAVVSGMIPAPEGRIPMSDGAGEDPRARAADRADPAPPARPDARDR